MTIRPVVLNGMIQRTQDLGNIKQQEDNKPVVQQQNISIQHEKREDQLAHQVQQTEQKEIRVTVMMRRKREIMRTRAAVKSGKIQRKSRMKRKMARLHGRAAILT